MALLDLNVELAETNRLLARIADALDRGIPLAAPIDHSKHPLIGLSDISRMTAARASEADANRATMPISASQRVQFSNSPDGPHSDAGASASPESASVTGAWDHEDPLDDIAEFDRGWSNYPGTGI